MKSGDAGVGNVYPDWDKDRKEVHQARLDELRKMVMVGIEELDRGEGGPWNLDEIKAEGQKLLESRKKLADTELCNLLASGENRLTKIAEAS